LIVGEKSEGLVSVEEVIDLLKKEDEVGEVGLEEEGYPPGKPETEESPNGERELLEG